jgi:ribonuclease T2
VANRKLPEVAGEQSLEAFCVQTVSIGRMRYDLAVLRKKLITIALVLALLLILSAAVARKWHHPTEGLAGKFDYYLLSLSWAPTYCADHPNDNSAECRRGEHKGFVLHGLWPQSKNGAALEDCGSARPVSQQIVRRMLAYFPSASLIQHEWAKHGTCSGLSVNDYFTKAEEAFKAVQVPDTYKSLSQQRSFAPRDIESNFAGANHASENAFRISCHDDELVGVEVCMSKELQFQACSDSVRECSASQVRMLSPR